MAEPLVCQITEAVERHARAIDVRAKRRPSVRGTAHDLFVLWSRYESRTAISAALTGEGLAPGTADDIAAKLHGFADGVTEADPRQRYEAHSALVHLVKDAMVQHRKANAAARDDTAAPSWSKRKDIW